MQGEIGVADRKDALMTEGCSNSYLGPVEDFPLVMRHEIPDILGVTGYQLKHGSIIWQPAAQGSYVPVVRTDQPLTWWTHWQIAEIARDCLDSSIRSQVEVVKLEVPGDYLAPTPSRPEAG